MGEAKEAQRAEDQRRLQDTRRQQHDATRVEDEWEDSDWECEPRAPVPQTGNEMDGRDVGCIPSRVLSLPKSAVACRPSSVYGRSIFTSDFAIPRMAEV